MKANCMLDVENFYINKLNITTNFLFYLCFFFLFLITGKLTCKKKVVGKLKQITDNRRNDNKNKKLELVL